MSEHSDQRSIAHVPALDGIRALAIGLVLFQHLTVITPDLIVGTGTEHTFARGVVFAANLGWTGVDLFFVLSGFLITSILIATRDRSDYFKRFYVRRAFRILPLFLVIAIISFVIIPYSGLLPPDKAARFDTVGNDQWMYWLFLSNIAIANYGQFRHGIMDVTWSLAIEEQFYILWPLALLLVRNNAVRLIAAIIVTSMLLRFAADNYGVNRNSIYVFTLTRLDGLAFGALLAFWMGNPDYAALIRRWSGPVALTFGSAFLLLGVVQGGYSYYYDDGLVTWGVSLVTISFAALIGFVITRETGESRVVSLLSTRPLLFLGSVSYCVYLIHLPIRAAVRDLWMTPDRIVEFGFAGLLGQAIYYLVCLAITLPVAWLSRNLFERPLIAMGQRLTSSLPAKTVVV
jgi:peptidoglycan/LPS O-acetylase OafA/YrhL